MDVKHYSREELIRHVSLTDSDIEQVKQCRGDYNRLGFGYLIGFVRLENRLPTQYTLEIIPDLLTLARCHPSKTETFRATSVQLQIDENLITQYQKRRQTISQHQIRIAVLYGRKPSAP